MSTSHRIWSYILLSGPTNNFLLSEIIDDPSLIFSPRVFLFGFLFGLDAFEAPSLTSMEVLRKLLIEGGRQQVELPCVKA